ncbi:enoyl-CoA hydratase-related protein [Rhodobacteraceae bacterium]|nr:enoyl-CoA hydratase-related protein [Paracoccaceae bacterium]
MGREEQVAPAEKIRSERRDDVLVITIDNPPTATLTGEVRKSLLSAIEAADADESALAVILTGNGTMFANGAGLQEVDGDDAPSLADLCDRLEACAKPVVAAIEGSALGGGLEVALAAHLRVAKPGARLGAPDTTLGLIPNAGGTQRLPKVIGGVAALKLLLSGRAVAGDVARKLGLVDVLEENDLLATAIAHAKRLAESGSELRRSSLRRDRLGAGTDFLEAVSTFRKAAEASPLEAPIRMIECVEAALLLPYEIGRGMEQAAFEDLVDSEHSKSLRYVFSAERQLQAATKWEGRTPSRKINGVAVIGLGGVGSELVVQCLDAGFDVMVAEANDAALEDGVARIIGYYDARIAAGQISEDHVEDVLDRMQAVSGLAAVPSADIVIDHAQALTRERVSALDSAMKAGAVLIVGGERVGITTVAAMTGRETDVVGMRFYPGLKKNRLVELAAGEKTDARAMSTGRAFARKIDRLILDTPPGKDAIGSRILEALHAAADLCLEDGARILQIDLALKDWGIPHGSFLLRDQTGIRRVSAQPNGEGTRGGGIDAVLISVGRLGMQVGRGYYVYEKPGGPGAEDEQLTEMVAADRHAKSITPRRVSDAEIRFRCVSAMAGAGAQLLMEGLAKRPTDIDMVAIHGLGFARRTGGVMYAADLFGLEEIHKHLLDMGRESARIPSPPSMIQDLIRAGQSFSDLNA